MVSWPAECLFKGEDGGCERKFLLVCEAHEGLSRDLRGVPGEISERQLQEPCSVAGNQAARTNFIFSL